MNEDLITRLRERATRGPGTGPDDRLHAEAADALEAAQPAGEPVAWLNHYACMPPRIDSAATTGALRSEPLYTHPAPQAPMTEGEIHLAWNEAKDHNRASNTDAVRELVRAIEAHYKIGGKP